MAELKADERTILESELSAWEKDLETLQAEIDDPSNTRKEVSEDLYQQVTAKIEQIKKELA